MTDTKAVPALLRAMNERTVLETLRASGPTSRAEVARRTRISRPTVSLVLRTLLEDGLVRETEHEAGDPTTAPSTTRPTPRPRSSSASTSARV